MLRQWRREVFFISMNEINFAFQRKKNEKKNFFFPVLISFNDLSCDFFHLSFLMYKNFHLLFLWNFKEASVWGEHKRKKLEDIRKSECLEIHEFLLLMVKLDSFKVVISWIIPYLMEHGILFNIIIQR